MTQTIYQVDAFTDKPFAGNPAAVCILPEPANEAWMRNVAMEMNLSETAFLYAQDDGFNLRWFTPAVEVDLCGHATLASAHILWETGTLAPDQQVRFHTRSGLLTADLKGDWIEMDFPAAPVHPENAPTEVLKGLGIAPMYVGENDWNFLIEVESESILQGLNPDFGLLGTLPNLGFIVTSRAESDRTTTPPTIRFPRMP